MLLSRSGSVSRQEFNKMHVDAELATVRTFPGLYGLFTGGLVGTKQIAALI